MEKNHPLMKSPGAGIITSAATLILLGWSSGSYAATINSVDCDALSRNTDSPTQLQRFDASKLRPIDHVPIHDSAANIESLDSVGPIDNDAATPFLYLTPRVASALREIFDSPESEVNQADEDSVISSPVAGTEDVPESIELLEDSVITESIDDEFDRLILRRQMFRTDI